MSTSAQREIDSGSAARISGEAADAVAGVSRGYAWYVLLLLTLVYVASFIDLELRGAWVNIAERGAPSGFSGTLGIALVL